MDIALVLAVIYFSLIGSGLGSLTGLLPGIHVNTLALILVSSAPTILPVIDQAALLLDAGDDLSPLLLVAVIVSAAVAHSFLDFLPSTFLGAPDEDTSLAVLPGHRLLLAGRGLDAVLCAARGSLVGASVAVAMCLPLCLILGPPLDLYPVLDTITPFIVAAALAALILSEKGKRKVAEVRVRHHARCGPVVSVVHQVPVDGLAATISGTVENRFPRGRWIATPTGSWRLRGRRVPRGRARVEGSWMVRQASRRERALASSLLLVSGLLGLACTEHPLPLAQVWSGLGQSIMFPLLTGLFGLPALLASAKARPIPRQEEPEGTAEIFPGIRGALSGALVGWFPGISSTTGVIIGSALQRRDRDALSSSRRFITMVAAVGTSSTVLGLLALTVAFKGRSGAMMAAKDILGPEGASLLALPSPWLPLLLVSVLVSSLTSYYLALWTGRWLAARASGADLGLLNKVVIVLIVLLTALFCGLPGLEVLIVATLLGSVPPKLEVSRVHLTGCMLLPTALYFLGIKDEVLALL